jgi:multidrug resistance efflux pump
MSDEKETVVRVSIRDIFEVQQEQGKVLLRIDSRGERSDQKIANLEAIIATQDARIRVLENYRWQSIGAFGVILVVAGWVVTVFL